ncbi:hypothetical protein SCHPADRAFT_636301 [Schizopora paradoxa]|uniref:Uncharacterized protein n=1 Tax=Schizopora paradoxa TaxID=27342 RepID=A0A0H2R779_9AGAM|nr:hypothetical protein SCHPADRAFT_636301 [Schizopora paradoxa]
MVWKFELVAQAQRHKAWTSRGPAPITLLPPTTMSTLFGHTWVGDTCILRSPPQDSSIHLPRSAAQDLPSDVLLQIFLWAQLVDKRFLKFFKRSVCEGRLPAEKVVPPSITSRLFIPRAVSQVCQAWRGVALGSANLWTTIVIHDQTRLFSRPHALKELLIDVLRRSQRAPLTIAVKLYSKVRPGDFNPIKMLLMKLMAERTRWKHVSIISLHDPFPFAGIFLLDDLPLLEELALMFRTEPYDRLIKVDLSKSSRLHSLRLSGNMYFASRESPLKSVKHAEVLNFSYAKNCAFLLHSAQNIQTLRLDVLGGKHNGVWNHNPIFLPSLSEFSITAGSLDEQQKKRSFPLIKKIFAPSLKFLKVEGWALPAFESLIQRSKCSIKNLTIGRYGDSDKAPDGECGCTRFLRYTPGLKNLVLVNVKISSDMLASLIVTGNKRKYGLDYPEAGTTPLSSLKKITIELCAFEGVDLRYAQQMVAIVSSRLSPGKDAPGLKAFHITKSQFAPLQADGHPSTNIESNVKFMSEVRQIIEDGIDAKYRFRWIEEKSEDALMFSLLCKVRSRSR